MSEDWISGAGRLGSRAFWHPLQFFMLIYCNPASGEPVAKLKPTPKGAGPHGAHAASL